MAPIDDIAHWRIHIFSRLMRVVVVLGAISALPGIVAAARDGLYAVTLLDACALAWVIAIWRLERWSYRTRAIHFLALLLLLGIGLMLTIGPISLAYLMAPPVMAAVLLGTGPAIAMLLACSLSILVLGVSGYASLYVNGMDAHALVPTLVITLNYLSIATLITVSSSSLLRHLGKSLHELHAFAASLESGRNELAQVNAELRLTSAAVARLNDLVLIADATPSPGGTQPIIFANDAFLRRTGYRREEVLGHSMRLLGGDETDPAELGRILDAMARKTAASAELVIYTKEGAPFWVEMEIVPFADDGGNNTHWVVVARDITERRKSATDIHRLAFFDVLTGLPNRRLLVERINLLLVGARSGHDFGALMFIDLDHFKFINDARGHATGDALLRSAAARLDGLVRAGDTVARLGGDEFVVLLGHLGRDLAGATQAAMAIAEKIRAALTQAFVIDGQPYHAPASIGVALLGRDGQTAHDLLREADTAMYSAKAGGRNSVAFYEDSMRTEVERRLTLERELAAALGTEALSMQAQLQVASDGSPVGAELLMRWTRTDGSSVAPDVFIPLAESNGLIVPLGHWALRQACLCWLELQRAGHAMPLSVNVSPTQFRQPDFVAQVRDVIAESGVPPTQLILEVTEGLLVDHMEGTIGRMVELAAMGIRFSIDDFGTGYSNLGYLKRMPLYELKIDKSFIRDTPGDANGTAIVQSILAMASHLGLRVVAEGVETPAQARFLAANGAPFMQGYLYARPLPVAELVALLDERRAGPACAA